MGKLTLRILSKLIGAQIGLALLHAGTGALAQTADLRTIEEIVRKAEAKDAEGGFCSTTGWPPGDSVEAYTAHLRAAAVGSWKVNRFANGNCQYDRVVRLHQENGGRCVTYNFWECVADKRCSVGRVVDCLDANGRFVSRRAAGAGG